MLEDCSAGQQFIAVGAKFLGDHGKQWKRERNRGKSGKVEEKWKSGGKMRKGEER